MGVTLNQELMERSDASLITPRLVHKVKAENVWLTQADEVSGGGTCVQFVLPQAFNSGRIADLLEVQRQAGIHFVHTQLGVPSGKVFMLASIALHRSNRTALRDGVTLGGRVLVRSIDDIDRPSRRQIANLGFQMTVGDGIASGGARVRFLAESAYVRMRRSKQVQQAGGGSPSVAEPLIKSGGLYEAPITVDAEDQLLTDHESDHVSAMAIIVSVEHGLLELGAERVDSFMAEFLEYVEVGLPAHYALSLRPDGAFVGTVQQGERVCATFEGRAVGISQTRVRR